MDTFGFKSAIRNHFESDKLLSAELESAFSALEYIFQNKPDRFRDILEIIYEHITDEESTDEDELSKL